MVPSKPKRVGIYLRVSTGGQTVENQRLDLRRVAEQRGWEVVGEYVDHGVSGTKAKRPALDRLAADAAHGKLDVVAAWSLDRLGRSLQHVVGMLADLSERKVAVYLHQQQVDGTTAAGRAMLGMCAVFAEFERSVIVERVHAGLARARAQGKRLGRPTSVTPRTERRIRELLGKGVGMLKVARTVGCGTSTVQRIAREARR